MNKNIDRIVELEIDLDDMQLEEMGVEVVSFVQDPAIEVDFFAFNKEADYYVDEKGFEGFRKWIYANQELFKKPGGGAAGDGGVNHGAQMKLLEEAGIETGFPFGYCFQVAQFLFYAAGGYESAFDLKCIKKMEYQVNGVDFQSTHWYIQNRETGQIVDLTAQQFDGILDLNQYYPEGRRANLGFPYYNVGNKKVEFDNTVPSIQTLKLYDKYREDVEKLEGIEKYYKAAKYEELRKEFEMQFAKEYFVYPTAGESESDFITRCMPVVTGEGYDNDQALAICYSYYEGQSFEFSIDIFGYMPQYFDICPAATALFEHLVEMQPEEEERGMIRSAALQADKIFEIEKRVLELGEATESDVRQAALLANDFIDLMREIDEELEMSHDVSWMMGHIETIASYYRGAGDILQEMDVDTSALSPYVDPYGIKDLKVKENFEECHVMTKEEEEIILRWAEEHGELVTEEYTYINPNEEFSTVSDIATAIQGLDILGKMGVRQNEPAEIKYKYTGPEPQRGFCKAMMRLNKVYSESDMTELRSRLSTINPGMGPSGSNSYDVFKYKGGVNCQHFWSTMALFKPEGSRRVLMIDQGPAEGDAGKSNNGSRPSPTGAVSNNASLRFSFATDDEKRIVAGPLMIPNQFIMRRDENGEPYYVYFSKDTIKRIQERFNTQKRHNVTDLDHNGEIIEDNILLEQWIVESRQHDKSRFYGFNNLPMGTWFGVYKVNDDKTWKRIKNGELKGFSIAGDFINKAKPVIDADEDKLSKIINILKQIDE